MTDSGLFADTEYAFGSRSVLDGFATNVSNSTDAHHRLTNRAQLTGGDRIAASFGQATSTYHEQAYLQQHCAQEILNLLDTFLSQGHGTLPSGPILEVGCGTGFITELLLARSLSSRHPLWHNRDYHITDLSSEMVRFCQDRLSTATQHAANKEQHFSRNGNVSLPKLQQQPMGFHFHTLDAEKVALSCQHYSLIIGGFVAQWFQDLAQAVSNLLGQLQPGGWLLLSFPGHKSFPEWRRRCNQLSLPFTGHPLPNVEKLLETLDLSAANYRVEVITHWYPTFYSNAAAFFRSMKAIGAGITQSGQQLTPEQMRKLLREWQPTYQQSCDPPSSAKLVKVTYETIYLLIQQRLNQAAIQNFPDVT